jgi:hypothetical protein
LADHARRCRQPDTGKLSQLTANLVFAPAFRFRGRRQREFQIANLQGILVVA